MASKYLWKSVLEWICLSSTKERYKIKLLHSALFIFSYRRIHLALFKPHQETIMKERRKEKRRGAVEERGYEVLSSFYSSNSVAEVAFQDRVTYDIANIYVNQFLRTGNCFPREEGGANHVVVSDWIEAYILCNPMLYLSEIRERVKEPTASAP